MPTYQFEAMDATGQEIKDVIEAASEEEAQTTIRQMGYFVTKISVKKGAGAAGRGGRQEKRGRLPSAVRSKHLSAFTRQLSILQDAGLPILRSLRILEGQCQGRAPEELADGRRARKSKAVPRCRRPCPSPPRRSTGCT